VDIGSKEIIDEKMKYMFLLIYCIRYMSVNSRFLNKLNASVNERREKQEKKMRLECYF